MYLCTYTCMPSANRTFFITLTWWPSDSTTPEAAPLDPFCAKRSSRGCFHLAWHPPWGCQQHDWRSTKWRAFSIAKRDMRIRHYTWTNKCFDISPNLEKLSHVGRISPTKSYPTWNVFRVNLCDPIVIHPVTSLKT